MLKKIERYYDDSYFSSNKINTHLECVYFMDDSLKMQGFYKTFYYSGNINFISFEVNSEAYGISIGFLNTINHEMSFLTTNFKNIMHGIYIDFYYD